MTTKFIGMKDFRQNIASYTKEAQLLNIQFIILKKNVPVLQIKPVDEKDFALEKLVEEVKEARAQAKRGEVYTQDEIMQSLGIK